MDRHTSIGFVSLVLCAVLGLSASRFCPREERDGLECRAPSDGFKCGIFFSNLLGRNEIKWIGALPDVISRVQRKSPEVQNRVLPKVGGKAVNKAYFKAWSSQCDATEANDKCYALFNQRKGDQLDSCEETIGNLEGRDTIGNQLCAQARRFLEEDGQSRQSSVRYKFYNFVDFICCFIMLERPGDLIPVTPQATSIPWTKRHHRFLSFSTEVQLHLRLWFMTQMLEIFLHYLHISILTGTFCHKCFPI